MKAKKGFLLREMCDEHILVPVGEESEKFNGLITLNNAAVWLWEQLGEEITEDELVHRMCDRYEGLTEETARADLREFLDTVKIAVDM